MDTLGDYYKKGNNGHAVLLSHSLGRDPSDMKELSDYLNALGYTVSCPLYPGHGKSMVDLIKTCVYDWYDHQSHELQKLLKQHDKVFVVGMSIGGTIAVNLAEQFGISGLITINAPIIGFDIKEDIEKFNKNETDKCIQNLYYEHRYKYFHYVTNLGQKHELKKISCPQFILQGANDKERYKISSSLLMEYTSSQHKVRKDYEDGNHLLLLEKQRVEVIKDVSDFIQQFS
jgi:carboxylesterase